MNTYWYSITSDEDEPIEEYHSSIEAENKYEACKELMKKLGPWDLHKRLHIFDSYEAYLFYIKKGNYQWLDEKDIIKISEIKYK